MCTVSWHFDSTGYELLFNRDELRTRGPGLPPELRTQDGVRYLAPTDSDRGGTWIGVNEYGVTHCLVNYYRAYADSPDAALRRYSRSRGDLVREVQAFGTVSGSETYIDRLDLEVFAPFWLLAFEPGSAPRGFRWDGARYEKTGNIEPPVTTSSYRPDDVVRWRRARFPSLDGDRHARSVALARLWRYHRRRNPLRGAFGVCMSRSDARTVSFTRVSVTTTAGPPAVRLGYLPDPPCRSRELPLPIEIPAR